MEVVVNQFDGVTTFRALPLAAGLLVATARRDPLLRERAVLRVRTARIDPDLAVPDRADVLAFSMYVWNERYSLEVARRAKLRLPGAFVVLGGPSVPRRPQRAEEFLREHPYVDALVFGEGELAFRDLLRGLHQGTPLAKVPGLALKGSGLTAPRARITDLEETGSPFLDGTFDALVDEGFAPGAGVLETNRGCPFECTFCDWGQATASRIHELPIERLRQELEWIAARRISYLYLVDANFGIRRRDLGIVRAIGELKARTGFPQYVFFHLTKNATERHLEVVLALGEAGIGTHLALSAQDFEPAVLLAVKRDNIRLDRALALRKTCHERGIPTFNEMILGLPEQTYASFARSMVKAITPWPGDVFQLYLARMIENAEMAAPDYRARYGLETRRVLIASYQREGDAGPVPELEEIVVASRAMPAGEWRRAFRFGFFLAAAHNLRLLDVVVQISQRQGDLLAFLEDLLARLPSVARVLDRYADAILAGEAMVLPASSTGEHLWAVEDAVLLAALTEREAFFDQVEAIARERGELLAEAVRYQRFITPAPAGDAWRTGEFAHDFAAWRAAGTTSEAPARAAARFSWRAAPGLAAAGDPRSFMLAYLAAVHARQPTFAVAQNA